MKISFKSIYDKALIFWEYCAHGVWSDTRPIFRVNAIKTLNISLKSFLNADLQSQACALTYRTMLAVVPALALIFAIGRGFGLQDILQDELYKLFPSQHQFIDYALGYVDTYLNQASEGIFVGVGIVFLLWTLISLVSSVEDSFNHIWGAKQGRSLGRKIVDYTATFLILPVLMICGSGFSIFINDTVRSIFDMPFLSPLISWSFEGISVVFTCLFFTAMFMMIPNTRVKFKNALISGVFTGIAFLILQWIFITGQMYVAKYNAIYGSFSFLPLLLIWLQLVWVAILSGSLICYASQNIFQYSFNEQISNISRDYYDKVCIAVVAVVLNNFKRQITPATDDELIRDYGVPSRLVKEIAGNLCDIGVLSQVIIDEKRQIYGYHPAIDTDLITIKYLRTKMYESGKHNFIPNFEKKFKHVVSTLDNINQHLLDCSEDILVADLKIHKKE